MLLQALARYADSDLAADLADESFETKPVPYGVEIDERGRFLQVMPMFDEQQVEGAKKPKTIRVTRTMLIPKSPVNRNSGVYPLLGVDAIQYVVGPEPGAWTKPGEHEKHEKHHTAFVELIREAAELTGDPWLKAACRFYDDPAQVAAARVALAAEKPQGGANVALFFSPDLDSEDPGGAIVSSPVVKGFWRRYYEKLAGARHAKGGEGVCMISGKFGPIAVTHDKIKGASSLGGQAAGVALMSFDKQAYCSYGWEQNQNGPICPERAAAYVLALNDLMQKNRHRQGRKRDSLVRTRTDHGGMAFLYWTRDREDIDVMEAIDFGPDADMIVADMLDAPWTGRAVDNVNPNWFYLLTVSGNGGRLVVHDWHAEALASVQANIRAWRENLQVPDVFNQGQPSRVPSVYWLIRSIMAPGMKDDSKLIGHWKLAMVRRAFFGPGFSLGYPILIIALERLRRESGRERSNVARMGLIRLCVNDIAIKEGWMFMPSQLDIQNANAAYVCGRILAYYDYLQGIANYVRGLPHVGVSISDKLFASASMRPALAMPRIERLGRTYLKVIRGLRPGYAYNLEKYLHEITLKIAGDPPSYPDMLNPAQQGCFALGFHHQKAELYIRKNDDDSTTAED